MTGVAQTVIPLDKLSTLVGMQLGPTSPMRLSQSDVNEFARITGDSQWLHIDVERAKEGPYNGTIVHGYLTLSLCSRVIDSLLSIADVEHSVNYGLDRVRFPSALRVGSDVHGSLGFVRAEPTNDWVDAVWLVTIGRAGDSKPACVAHVLSRYFRARQAAADPEVCILP